MQLSLRLEAYPQRDPLLYHTAPLESPPLQTTASKYCTRDLADYMRQDYRACCSMYIDDSLRLASTCSFSRHVAIRKALRMLASTHTYDSEERRKA